MPTFDDIAIEFATDIRKSIHSDRVSAALGMLKEAQDVATKADTVATFRSIGKKIDTFVYEGTSRPLSDVDKDDILKRTARKLEVGEAQLSEAVKSASNDNALVVVNQIISIIISVKDNDKS